MAAPPPPPPPHEKARPSGRKAQQLAELSHEVIKEFADSITAASFETPVKCCACEATCATATGLVTHLKKHKGVKADLTNIEKVRNEMLRSKREASKGAPKEKLGMTELERSSLAPCSDDYTKVKCKDPKCKKEFSKFRVVPHFLESQHHKSSPIPSATTKEWRSTKDGWMINHKKAKELCTSFEFNYDAAKGQEPSQAPPSQGSQSQASSSDFGNLTTALRDVIASAAATAGSPRPSSTPVLPERIVGASLREKAVSFRKISPKQLAGNLERRINEWPLANKCGFLPPGVGEFITARTDKPKTAESYIQGVEYFFSAFEVADPTAPFLTIYKQLANQGLISRAMTLELWDASIPWTSKMVAGMLLFADWLAIHAEDLKDDEGCRLAGSMASRYLKPLQKQLPKAKNIREARRFKIDRARRLKMADVQTQGEAVNWTIIDLNIICDAYLDTFEEIGTIPASVRKVINACTIGIYASRTYPGRPGELEHFPFAAMEEFLADAMAWYVIVEEHKTELTFGPVGRYIPAELRAVLMKVIKFSDKMKNLLFTPARAGTECIAVNPLTLAWNNVYQPGFQHPEPTLNRKAVETEIADKKSVEKAAEMNSLIPVVAVEAAEASNKMARCAVGNSVGELCRK